MEKWAKTFDIPLPECSKCGTCCLCASPSKNYKELLKKAAEGDQFARDFFSIFIPYKNIEHARKVCGSIVDRVLKNQKEDVVFYHCRHYHFEKKCIIYKDRPQLCRDFPGSPFVILAEHCAYYEWAKQCKAAYNKLQKDLEDMKNKKAELENIRYQNKCINLLNSIKKVDDKYKFILSVPSMCLVSPSSSWIR